jgi:hypothetical protein
MRLPQRFAALGGVTAAGMVVVGIAAPAQPAPTPPPAVSAARVDRRVAVTEQHEPS